jgi:membrane-associated phospholipid phosphatase
MIETPTPDMQQTPTGPCPCRVAPLLAFMQARLSPQGYLGLHLTLGVLVLIGATWLFGAIAEDVVTKDPLTRVDMTVAAWLHARATPRLTVIMVSVSHLGGVWVVSGIALLFGLYLVWRRQWYWLLALVLTVPGGMGLNVLLKDVFGRARPLFTDPLVTLGSYSFPSGHTMTATVLYGVLAAHAVSILQTWRGRVLAVFVAGLAILLVGFSRIYLGAHYLSDVLGALAEGLAWLAFCLTGVDTVRRRRCARHDTAAHSQVQP